MMAAIKQGQTRREDRDLLAARLRLVSTLVASARAPRNPDRPLVVGVASPLTDADLAILSEAKAKALRKQFRLGRCFPNAQRLALADDRVSYVEGLATTNEGWWKDHAWNLIDGKIVDVTWRIFGSLPASSGYVGLRFTRAAVLERWIAMASGRQVDPRMLKLTEVERLQAWIDARPSTEGAPPQGSNNERGPGHGS